MTEQEWAVSEDPAAMLVQATQTLSWKGPRPSDRKLRLFACACCRLRGSPSSEVDGYEEFGAPGEIGEFPLADAAWAAEWARPMIHPRPRTPAPAQKSAILRDLVGNPFRPVALPPGVLTPQVQVLAQAAYECRERQCCCWGVGTDGQPRPAFACDRCRGTGKLDDGTLDHLRLAVLSDALEEAGLGGEFDCGACNGLGYIGKSTSSPAGKDRSKPCPAGCKFGILPHPILAHLRDGGIHVRGCWAVDLVLGKE